MRPDINKIDSIINNCAKGCFYTYFHTLKSKCIYDIEMAHGDFVNGLNSDAQFKK